MNSENFVVIQGWMCNELELKGNDLLIYALIYGFSQDGKTEYSGGRNYIAKTFNISLPTVDKALKNLISRDLIIKICNEQNGVLFVSYKISLPVVKKLYGGSKETLHNNIDNNINNKTISKDIVQNFEFGAKKSKPKKESLYDKCMASIVVFTDDEILRSMLAEALKQFLENSRESGTPFYTNHFKGKLNTLKKLSDDNYVQRKIVKQTLDNGWNGFYALKMDKVKNNNTHDRLNESGTMDVEHSDRRKRGDFNGAKF